MKKILILFAHPAFHKSMINSALIGAVRGLENVTINELYENYPDFFIDVEKEKKLLVEHDIIVWHHPFYWYSAPAILKEWMDLVLQHGFAYGRTGRALQGKWVLSAVSTGGRQEVYTETGSHHYSVNEFLIPFKQSATLCRMRYLPPFVTHGAHTITPAELNKQAARYLEAITGLRDEKYPEKDFENVEYFNHLTTSNA
ncbi:NAD(P)H-dependent oxidoreductase [Maribellus sp. YY47]|uniref:glutathione-regulated potassium-efflux system oxidoreductase KefF n=1 Tax=Maribellus sp. YY47 TaxID=2929486 RepID=UPI002000C420|nr:NAD(P)H-dependent oxidoreductase [Maribellus sp. YY47]MCK3683277.1 NAD(P)H-dependent oxidoreductase [Maribellus sp. YY47]